MYNLAAMYALPAPKLAQNGRFWSVYAYVHIHAGFIYKMHLPKAYVCITLGSYTVQGHEAGHQWCRAVVLACL